MKYLLDTCILSETVRRVPSERVMAWFATVDERDLFLPAIVLGELRKGAELRDDDARKIALSRWVDECHAEYGDRIVPFDDEVADLWGKMVAHLQKQGKMPPVIDSQIAATAVRYGMALVTRNVRDMADFGVEIVNPFGA